MQGRGRIRLLLGVRGHVVARGAVYQPPAAVPEMRARDRLVLAQHFNDKHSSIEMPPELQTAVALGKHERAHVSQLLTKKRASSVCGGVACCPKAKAPRTR